MTDMARTRGALPRPTLTHAERQALIRAPFRCELPGGSCEAVNPANTVVKGRTWGGVTMMAGSGGYSGAGFDDSYLRYGAVDDPRQGEL